VNEQMIEVGTIVTHPNRAVWGPGKTLSVGGGGQVTVYFRDLEEDAAGDAVKTISTGVVGLEIAPEQSDAMLDNIPPFAKGRFKGVRKPRLSLDQAVAAFLELHPEAFGNPDGSRNARAATVRAHEMWVDGLGGGQGDALLDEGKIDEIRRRVLGVGAELDLLTPTEKLAFEEALNDDGAAEPFLRALVDVANQVAPEHASYQRLIEAVHGFSASEGDPRVATWAVLTHLPFIACPEHHIHLKPAAVQKCAARLNFDIRFTTALNWWTYARLLQMAGILLARLEPLGAKDQIDVQSFIRVIATV
jgi:hypothetical protein